MIMLQLAETAAVAVVDRETAVSPDAKNSRKTNFLY